MAIDRALLAASWRSWYDSDFRVVGPGWLQLVWTAVFSFMVGLGFTVLGVGAQLVRGAGWPSAEGLLRQFLADQVIAQVIGLAIHGLFAVAVPMVGARRIRAFGTVRRALFFTGIPLLGVVVGWPLGTLALGAGPRLAEIAVRPGAVAGMLMISLLVSYGCYRYFGAQALRFEAQRRAAEAQLRLLQGQIEPHFIFNTLANVLSLIDIDTARARQTLEAFIDYLRASLAKLRDGDSTLADELALSHAYLTLMQARMGARLAFRFDIADDEVRRAVMPPLLLQPLVENAVVHGLERKVDGGTVTVAVRRDGARLVLEVIDDGLGRRAASVGRAHRAGNGLALDNLRARLKTRWGDDAQLTLELQPDAGARAVLSLPFEAAQA